MSEEITKNMEATEATTPAPAVTKDCSTCNRIPASLHPVINEDGDLIVECPKCQAGVPLHEHELCPHCESPMPNLPVECSDCKLQPGIDLGFDEDMDNNWEPRGRTYGDNVTWHAEETVRVTQPLTEAEKLEYGQEMADALARIEELEGELDAQRKYYKRLIEEQEKLAKDASRLWREGAEEREIACDVLKDWNTGEMVWVEACEPHAEVIRRPMTEEERQLSLLDSPTKPELAAEEPEAVQ